MSKLGTLLDPTHRPARASYRTRRRWRWSLAAGIALASAPMVYGVAMNERAASKALERLAEDAPRATEVLRTGMRVEHIGGQCVAIVAKMMATELPLSEARAHLAKGTARGGSIAWAMPGAYWVEPMSGDWAPIQLDPSEPSASLPELPHHLLAQWAILPDGVRRIVVFRRVPLPASLDPRCLGA